ncbi:MAG: PGPGW domain-containing protein [Pirellulales bacterium]
MHLPQTLTNWVPDWSPWTWCALGVGGFFASLATCAVVLLYVPTNYFVEHSRPQIVWPKSVGGWLWRIARNLLGFVIFLVGVIMIFTPGQGVLSILLGLALMDFPGKHRLVRKLLQSGKVLAAANQWRAKFGKPALEDPDE